MGYRWFDANNVAPLFPFGHGLSYTSFAYGSLVVDTTSRAPDVVVTATVNNTGARAGGEIAQLYIGFPAAAGEPPKQLRDFAALDLPAGEASTAAFVLHPRDWSVWNVGAYAWAPVPGVFDVWVGASSRDLRLHGTFTVAADGAAAAA